MYKSCGRCGKIHSSSFICPKRVIPKSTDENKIRARNQWKMKSLAIRAEANNLCEACKEQGRYVYNNLEVHHITKLSEDKDKWLDDDNLICLCSLCHRKADKGQIDKEYLRRLAQHHQLNPTHGG